MKRTWLAIFILAVVARGATFAQNAVPSDIEKGQVLCLIEGTNLVVSAPAAEGAMGIRKATAADQALIAQARPSRIKTFLDNTDLRANIRMLDLDLVEGLTFGAKYKYQVEKSNLRPNYFTRVDRYVMGAGINPGTLIDGVTPISFGLAQETEILFIQQFENGNDARQPGNGYLPARLPVNTAKALSLKPGDYVRFNARLNALVGVSQAFTAIPAIEISAGANFVVTGDFQVHFFRLDASRVRLKLVALRSDEKNIGARLGLKGFEVFGDAGTDKALVRLSRLDEWFRAQVSSSNSDLFMVDYVINLADERAAGVFDRLFSSLSGVRTYKIANPVTRKEELAVRLTSNVAALEELALNIGELGKPDPMDRAVNRLFKGANSAYTKASAFRLGVLVTRLKRDERYRRNFLSRVNIDTTTGRESPEYYLVPTWNLRSEFDGLITRPIFGEEEMFRSANALFTATSEGVPLDFKNITFTRRESDTRVSGAEYRDAQQRVWNLLSASGREAFLGQVKDTAWMNPSQVKSAQIDLEYFFHLEALTELFKAGWGQRDRLIDAKFRYLITQNEDWNRRNREMLDLVGQAGREPPASESAKRLLDRAMKMKSSLQDEVSQKFGAESLDLCAKFETMLAPGDTGTLTENSMRRFEALIALRDSALFRKMGPGFVVFLLKESKIDVDKVLYVRFRMSAPGLPTIRVASGVKEDRELYDVVEFLEAMLDGSETDMRLAGPKDSGVARVNYEKLLERVVIATN